MENISKAYDPSQLESKWYQAWLKKGLFKAPRPGHRKPFCVMIPPPNVTGVLHMGHALNNTLQDVLIRWRRMQGRATLWQPGTDHAGIATQNVVEKEVLAKEGKTRHDLGREELIRRIWEWKEKYGSRILEQLKSLGASCDWPRTRFTLDEGLSLAVREAFVTLYQKGLIYRGKYLVNWCPRCQTALADDEVEHKEHQGKLWYVKYPVRTKLETGSLQADLGLPISDFIVVATTRPETMLGDTAVAVNPKDPRYENWVGRSLILPEVGRELPIVADRLVNPEFGTGAVKVTPAHDPNDFEMAKRHRLPMMSVMHRDATLNENVPEKYRGLTREACREVIVASLESQGLMEKTLPYTHRVGHCYRCDTVIEYCLSLQWFVKMRPLAKLAMQAQKEKKIRFYPKRWEKLYLHWLRNVRDWCISRQIWWGHRIPVWYCRTPCPPIVSITVPKKCPTCGNANLVQDEDVLDTWFSSALWPFSTLGWPGKTPELSYYYPTDTLVTDRGIIYFWVARMVMMGLTLTKKIPFRNVYIHGTILDEYGRVMSKSRPETCIDPVEVITKMGADALRLSLILLTSEGQDLKLSVSKFEMGRHFLNKLWNAARFVESYAKEAVGERLSAQTARIDHWILNRWSDTVRKVCENLEEFRFFSAGQTIYQFFWHEFCDWYLEAIKVEKRGTAKEVLTEIFSEFLKLAHPFIPFITEEIWRRQSRRQERMIAVEGYPKPNRKNPFAKEAREVELIQNMIVAIRNIRGEHRLPPHQKVEVFLKAPSSWRKIVEQECGWIQLLAGIGHLELRGKEEILPKGVAQIVGPFEILIPFGQLFDIVQERDRLQREIKQAQQELYFFSQKLENRSFLERAPAAVVQKEREKFQTHQVRLEKLKDAFQKLESV